MVRNLSTMQKTQVPPLSQEELLEKGTTIPVFLPRDLHGQRSPVNYSPWGRKASDRTERQHFHFHTLVLYLTNIIFVIYDTIM